MNVSENFPPQKYRMPAEWEWHDATCVAWPHNSADWPGKFQKIPKVFAEIVRHLAESEPVIILTQTHKDGKRTEKYLERRGVPLNRITCFICPTNRAWIRDTGPIFATNGMTKIGTVWHFNGWAKYNDYKRDQNVAEAVARFVGVPIKKAIHYGRHIVLEGGALDVDGRGNLIATEECLLDQHVQARNPGVSREEIEEILKCDLGVKLITWLARGIPGDDTHGHVDDVARFMPSGRVLLAADSGSYRENLERLVGANFEVREVPMLNPPIMYKGQLLPTSYLNFYIANTKVLVPTFGQNTDSLALAIINEEFPGREIVGINCTDLIWGLGAIHCLTQQIPKA